MHICVCIFSIYRRYSVVYTIAWFTSAHLALTQILTIAIVTHCSSLNSRDCAECFFFLTWMRRAVKTNIFFSIISTIMMQN